MRGNKYRTRKVDVVQRRDCCVECWWIKWGWAMGMLWRELPPKKKICKGFPLFLSFGEGSQPIQNTNVSVEGEQVVDVVKGEHQAVRRAKSMVDVGGGGGRAQCNSRAKGMGMEGAELRASNTKLEGPSPARQTRR